ncbi:MAG TPA: hypothetical protein PK154_03555 [Methanoregulaceae archaeon]|nr:hypothetical protein [Methanoregulaceae archaeon]HPW10172.1 hypothetical protein [Methanoregulaceae archaeon]
MPGIGDHNPLPIIVPVIADHHSVWEEKEQERQDYRSAGGDPRNGDLHAILPGLRGKA